MLPLYMESMRFQHKIFCTIYSIWYIAYNIWRTLCCYILCQIFCHILKKCLKAYMLLQHLTQGNIFRRLQFKPYNQIIREFIKVSKMLKNNTFLRRLKPLSHLLTLYLGETSLHTLFHWSKDPYWCHLCC